MNLGEEEAFVKGSAQFSNPMSCRERLSQQSPNVREMGLKHQNDFSGMCSLTNPWPEQEFHRHVTGDFMRIRFDPPTPSARIPY